MPRIESSGDAGVVGLVTSEHPPAKTIKPAVASRDTAFMGASSAVAELGTTAAAAPDAPRTVGEFRKMAALR
jgi:hypothetical protein